MCTFAAAADKGTLKVVVVDSEGASLPGVTVTISSPNMMGTKTQISNENGEALFINLFPALYEVKTNLENFQEVISKDIRVRVDKETEVRVEMKMSPLQESITVTAEYDLVDTKKSTIAEHVTHDYIEALPVSRDFVGYAQLVTGVNMVPNSQGKDTGQDPAGKGGLNYWARNARMGTRDNFYFLDGISITGLDSQRAGMTFNNEVIQEQQVMTSGVPAEYGGGRGVVANIITKSGGNNLSGSVNFYLQRKSFWGGFKGLAKEDERLQPYKDNKFDTAFTLGGPIMKDSLWFFVSGQYRNDSDTFNLSESASASQEEVDYSQNRYNGFGKLSFNLTNRDSLTVTYFLDYYDVAGSQSKNTVISRQSLRKRHYMAYNGHYQHVFSDNIIVNLRYGHYELEDTDRPRYPGMGINDTLYFLPGVHPRFEDFQFGNQPSERDNKNTRDQFRVTAEYYLGNMDIKAGLMYTNENDRDTRIMLNGEQYNSLDPNLSGWTLGELLAAGVFPYGEIQYRVIPNMNAAWDSTAEYYDFNNDGVVTMDELGQAVFTSPSEHGVKFLRWYQVQSGINKVRAKRWTGFVMDDWRISDQFTLNAGLRFENHNYRDSEGGEILHMKTVFLPRIGLAWDIGGNGTQKLTFFYGHYSDPTSLRPVHMAGDISGQVMFHQMWLANDWYTFKSRGSAEHRDMVFAPNMKDSLSREYSLTYETDLGNGLMISSQAYFRQDRNLLEDIDIPVYVDYIAGDPQWGHLALTWEDFGYPAEGPSIRPNFFLANLYGGKRDIYGFDFEVSKRFKNGSLIVGQYSFKDGRGNSTADQDALFQGDMVELDCRNPWMWGPLPGTIPHKLKLFGTYRTPFGLNIGGIFYWTSGIIFTESYLQYDAYLNYPLNDQWTELAKSGQEKGPGWYQIDLKLNYIYRFAQNYNVELFFDIYNLTDNQDGYYVEFARNSQAWDYKQVKSVLNPRRIYLGARFRF
jgi:hypothetical protein